MQQIPGLGPESDPTAINASGQVTGSGRILDTNPGWLHAFVYDASSDTTKDLGTLGGDSSYASDINASGQVVGQAALPPGSDGISRDYQAFIYDEANGMQELPTLPGRDRSGAAAINDSGVVVGTSQCSGSSGSQCADDAYRWPRAFLYKAGSGMQDLGTLPGGNGSEAVDVNNSGQVVGTADIDHGSASRAFIYDEANGMQELGTLPGGSRSQAFAINDSGAVIGQGDSAEGYTVPFLYKDGAMFDLNTLIPADSGWRIMDAHDINNNGQIVGYGQLNGSGRAFLLTPKNTTPQPVDSASSEVAAGGTLSTATGDGTASSSDPVNTTITSPVGGTVSITETSTAQQAPSGFTFFGEQVNIEAPEATVGNPLILEFVLDTSLLPEGQEPNTIEVFRNGTLVGECADASGTASPDPCVSKREALAGGDVAITVLTSHASAWNFAAPAYEFGGFYSPVDNLPTLNKAKAGSAIPVRFSLGGDMGLNVFVKDQSGSYPKSGSISCDSGANADTIEQTVNAGSSSLSYDASTGRYTYVWKTDKKWQNSCRQLVLQYKDGTEQHRANFQLTK
jgi:probable HAF family extracellular repeat protein